MMMMIGNWRIL